MFTGVKGSEHVTKETRKINTEFSEIEVSTGIDLQLTQSKRIKLEVEVDDNLQDLLITKVEDGVLKIYFSKNISSAKSKSVYLSAPVFNTIEASSGCRVSSTQKIKQSKLVIDASSGCLIELEVAVQNLKIEASSGSNISLKGITENLEAEASSGSLINSEELESQDAIVVASSGAQVHVFAYDSLTGNASSGGNIICDGKPKIKTIDESSGGNISF